MECGKYIDLLFLTLNWKLLFITKDNKDILWDNPRITSLDNSLLRVGYPDETCPLLSDTLRLTVFLSATQSKLMLSLLFKIPQKRSFVDKPLSVHLMYHVSIIVIAQSSAQLLVIHGGLVFPPTPLLCHLLRVVQFKLAILSNPHDQMSTASVCQQF